MKAFYLTLFVILLISCGKKESKKEVTIVAETKSTTPVIEVVASFKGAQVTGVSVSDQGRIFANFPRWRAGVPFSVVEVNPRNGSYTPYPNENMNQWKLGESPAENMFLAVQSVVAHADKLYVLDTRNPTFSGVVDDPRVFVFNLSNNTLERVMKFSPEVIKPNSYVNDLRVDDKLKRIYFTDSGAPGLLMMELESGDTRRILDNHVSTRAEVDHLTIDNKRWENSVHSDGIALDTKNDQLYYHSLTGYTLYSIPTSSMDAGSTEIQGTVKVVAKTAAPDGMIFDKKGNLYLADLEKHKINFYTPQGEMKTLVEGDKVRWADTFSIHDGYLYYTNSRIHEAGADVSEMTFTINKVKL